MSLAVEKSTRSRTQIHFGRRLSRFQTHSPISPKDYRKSTFSGAIRLTLAQPMKRAFVIRLSPDTNLAKGKFQGHVEEVDTGHELKFRSVEEFLAFLQECVADSSDGG
jgi:hypothetical protein